ncbi:MAG TPA: ATP-binding protein [Allosphingosinicella sp.]|nr:ATP-binding protein [Allosphingosinicella sp.]
MAFSSAGRLIAAAALFGCGIAVSTAAVHGLLGAATLSGLVAAAIAVAIASRPANSVAGFSVPADPLPPDDRDRLHALVDQSPSPLVVYNEAGRLDAVNRSARRMFKTDGRILEPPPELVEIIRGMRPPGVIRFAVAGSDRAFAVTTTETEDESGQAVIAALVDVEAELHTLEAAALRELMQVLSHEIMGALTPIASLSRTAADILHDREPSIEDARDAIETVANRAEGLEQFTSAYRRLARLPPPKLTTVKLARLIEDCGRLFRARFDDVGVSLDVRVPVSPIDMRADPSQVGAALWALLQNAAEAALANGSRATPRVAATAEAHATDIRIFIEDSGGGVEVADAVSIFRPFFTTKPRGSGVGLSLARQIVRAHGGEIELLPSQKKLGALFLISLPR